MPRQALSELQMTDPCAGWGIAKVGVLFRTIFQIRHPIRAEIAEHGMTPVATANVYIKAVLFWTKFLAS